MDDTGRGTVLIVEDDAAISDVVRTALEQEGFACRCAYSGSEACLLIEGGFVFDAAICDLMLPGASGEEVLAAIRSQGDRGFGERRCVAARGAFARRRR